MIIDQYNTGPAEEMPTPTATDTPTATPTATPTPAQTITPVITPPAASTFEHIDTSSETPVPPPTETPVPSPTVTPTSTPTPPTHVPEYPTIALPVAIILGMMFVISQVRKKS